MSEQPRQSAQPPQPTPGSDPLREIRHDLRHSLYVLDLALTLLEESRTDEARFSEILQMLRKEQSTISTLVESLLKHVADKGRGDAAPSEGENPPV